MNDSIDDLPEIQLEEVLGEEETAALEKAAATLPEIDIDLGDAGADTDEGLLAPAGAGALAQGRSRAPDQASGTSVVEDASMQLSRASVPENDFEPQFEIDTSVASIPTAGGDRSAAAGPLPGPEPDPVAAGRADIGQTVPTASGVQGGELAIPEERPEAMTGTAPDSDDIAIDIDLTDEDEPPVLPSAFETNEPLPAVRQPAVEPPSDSSLDLDAMLSDLEASSDGGGSAGGTGGPQVDALPGLEAEAGIPATEHEALALDIAPAALETEPEANIGPQFDEEAAEGPSPLEESMANAARVAQPPDESDAPPLPISDDEPGPIPGINLEVLKPDAETLATLKKLAGPGAEPESMRVALHAALKGEPYYAKALPDARAFMIGLARVLVSTGYSVNEMVDAIMAALED